MRKTLENLLPKMIPAWCFCFASKAAACDISTNKRSGRSAAGDYDVIICSCNVLSDHDVRSAVKTAPAPPSTGQVYGCLGCSPQCGRCARTIRRIIDEALMGACAGACTCGQCETV
jgi:bacterioferritin-associated ferredoxin